MAAWPDRNCLAASVQKWRVTRSPCPWPAPGPGSPSPCLCSPSWDVRPSYRPPEKNTLALILPINYRNFDRRKLHGAFTFCSPQLGEDVKGMTWSSRATVRDQGTWDPPRYKHTHTPAQQIQITKGVLLTSWIHKTFIRSFNVRALPYPVATILPIHLSCMITLISPCFCWKYLKGAVQAKVTLTWVTGKYTEVVLTFFFRLSSRKVSWPVLEETLAEVNRGASHIPL